MDYAAAEERMWNGGLEHGTGTYGTPDDPCLPEHWLVVVRAKQKKKGPRIWAANRQPIKLSCRWGNITLTQYQTSRVQPAGTWVMRVEGRWSPYWNRESSIVKARYRRDVRREEVLGVMSVAEAVEYASGMINAAVQLGEWRLV